MQTRKRTYNYRFYLPPEQEALLAQTFGCVRKVYNLILECRSLAFKERQEKINYSKASAKLTERKKRPEYTYINEVSSVPLQQCPRQQQTEYKNFSEGRAKYPSFKKTNLLALLIGNILLLGSPFSSADVYRFESSTGEVFYTTKAVKPRAIREFVKTQSIVTSAIPISARGRNEGTYPIHQAVLDSYIESAANQHGLDPHLIRAMIQVESGYNAVAVSKKGAMGLMQLMPSTAESIGVWDPMDPHQNIQGGAKFFRQLMDHFDSDLELALAAYNAGEANVIRHGRKIPPFIETQSYVTRVLDNYKKH